MKSDRTTPFRIDVAEEILADLRQRLSKTRWSYQVEGTNWDAGTDLNYLKKLVSYWQDTYDWRRHEAALNQFAHFQTKLDAIGIHFIFERGKAEAVSPHPYPRLSRLVLSIRKNNTYAHRSRGIRRAGGRLFRCRRAGSARLLIFRQASRGRIGLSR